MALGTPPSLSHAQVPPAGHSSQQRRHSPLQGAGPRDSPLRAGAAGAVSHHQWEGAGCTTREGVYTPAWLLPPPPIPPIALSLLGPTSKILWEINLRRPRLQRSPSRALGPAQAPRDPIGPRDGPASLAGPCSDDGSTCELVRNAGLRPHPGTRHRSLPSEAPGAAFNSFPIQKKEKTAARCRRSFNFT